MADPIPIHCPACGYDLSAAKSSAGECPECGYRFDAGALDARELTEVSLALGLLAWGALGAVLASGIGQSFTYLPRPNEGSAGSGGSAAAVMRLPLLLCVAYGVFSLSSLTGKTALARRWPMIVACTFSISAIVRLSPYARWGNNTYPQWLQPAMYGTIAEWVFVFAQGLLIIGGALAASRLIARLGAARLRGWVAFAVTAGGALTLFDLCGRLHTLYVQRVGPGPVVFPTPGTPPPPQPPFLQTRELTTFIDFAEGVAWWLAWAALGFLTLHLRALWKASARGRSPI